MTAADQREIDELEQSRFGHPVLFVSHHWLGRDHPDPDGVHLQRLRGLRDCWLIFDFSSFPQPPRDGKEEKAFARILASMDSLIQRVVVLNDPEYLTRGWCVFEYLVASISSTTVLDEVYDDRFVALRDWANTMPPVPLDFRGSMEAQQQNYIATRLLDAVNGILPVYAAAQFRDEHDSSTVTDLLVEHLRKTLPRKREHIQYMGEWKNVPWTDEEIRAAFDGTLVDKGRLDGVPVGRTDTDVPREMSIAVQRRYGTKRYGFAPEKPIADILVEVLNPATAILRMLDGYEERRRHRA